MSQTASATPTGSSAELVELPFRNPYSEPHAFTIDWDDVRRLHTPRLHTPRLHRPASTRPAFSDASPHDRTHCPLASDPPVSRPRR